MTDLLTRQNVMLVVLGLAALFVVASFWRAHLRSAMDFNALDLVMQDGKASRIGTAFMVVLGVTTWLMIDLQLKGRMTEGYLGIYVGAWVAPLVARVVFGQTTPPDLKKDSD